MKRKKKRDAYREKNELLVSFSISISISLFFFFRFWRSYVVFVAAVFFFLLTLYACFFFPFASFFFFSWLFLRPFRRLTPFNIFFSPSASPYPTPTLFFPLSFSPRSSFLLLLLFSDHTCFLLSLRFLYSHVLIAIQIKLNADRAVDKAPYIDRLQMVSFFLFFFLP